MSNAVMVSEENVAGVKHHLSIPLHYTMASASELRGMHVAGKIALCKGGFPVLARSSSQLAASACI